MPKCVYCKEDYHNPRGLTLVMKDGTINHLCSSKCRKNMFMKRRKVRWILKDKKDTPTLQRRSTPEGDKVETPEKEKVETKKETPKKEKAEDKK